MNVVCKTVDDAFDQFVWKRVDHVPEMQILLTNL